MASTVIRMLVNVNKDLYDVYIGRPTEWGNPWREGQHGTREQVVELHREWFLQQPVLVEKAKIELKGKVLGCHCVPLKCHGEVLVEVANAE